MPNSPEPPPTLYLLSPFALADRQFRQQLHETADVVAEAVDANNWKIIKSRFTEHASGPVTSQVLVVHHIGESVLKRLSEVPSDVAAMATLLQRALTPQQLRQIAEILRPTV